MKKRIPILIIIFLLILTLYGCEYFFELFKPSILLKYYQAPYQWAGIKLGETTREEINDLVMQIPDVVKVENYAENSLYYGDTPYCYELEEGFRESFFCVRFINNTAHALKFSSPYLTILEVEQHLGSVEEFAVVQIFNHKMSINYFGRSATSGFFIGGGDGSFVRSIFGFNDSIETIQIGPNEVFTVFFGSPEGISMLGEAYVGEDTWQYLTEGGGFQAWHGYGEYEVQKPESLN